MSTEPVNALAKQFAPDAGLTRACCLPHSRVEPCPQCAAQTPGRLPDAATRERQDARRYRLLKAHLAPGEPRPEGGSLWHIALGLAHTFDEAVDLLPEPCAGCGIGWTCLCPPACPHPLGDLDPETGHVVCVACGVDVQEEA